MIFVDTNIWYTRMVESESGRDAVDHILSRHAGALVTSDYVLDETLTLLRSRGYNRHALIFGLGLMSKQIARLLYLTPEDIAAAWDVFRRYSDKEWSFTDCTSKVIMERLGIDTALTFDHHIRQFGNVAVLP